MTRAVVYLRLVPATVWLVTQIVMAGVVAPAQSQPVELRKLAKVLQIDRITLCNKSENGNIAGEHCPWCQGFPEAILPVQPVSVRHTDCADHPAFFPARQMTAPAPAGLAYASRAPPA